MAWYKYLPHKYAESMIHKGTIRIGTLFDYQKEEIHGSEVGDEKEGTKSEMSYVEEASSNEELDSVGQSIVRFREGITGSVFKNCMLMSTARSPNLYIYSVSDAFSLSIMKRIGRESHTEYDTCVKIRDQRRFVEAITKALPEETHFLGSSACYYQERTRFFDKNAAYISPALLKSPRYKYQREIRAIWKPKDVDGAEAKPRIVTIPDLTSLCEIIYREVNLATDKNLVEKKEFCQDSILLGNASFYQCRFRRCNLLFSGELNLVLDSCIFDQCKWLLCNEAGNTLKFLKLLNCSLGAGGKSVFRKIIKQLSVCNGDDKDTA